MSPRATTGGAPTVVCVAAEFPSASETFIVAKVVGLLRRGWDVQVLCHRIDHAVLARRTPDEQDLLRGRIHLRPGRDQVVRHLGRVARSLLTDGTERRSLVRAARGGPRSAAGHLHPTDAALRRLAPDLVHFEFGDLARGGRRTTDRRGRPVPVLVSFRGYDLNFAGLGQPGYYDRVWARASAVHVLGRDLERRLGDRGCPAGLRRFVIPPGIDVDWFDGRGGPDPVRDHLEVVTVARLHWKKGLEHGVAAIRRAVDLDLDVRWSVAGAGEHEAAVRAAIAHFGLQDRVRLLGHVDRREVRELLRGADVVLAPSVSEGFGNAVLEAQAMEVPVVCSDADGLGENVEHGVTGLVVPRRDVEATAAALVALGRDRDRRRAMGRAGRRRVCRHFSLDAHLDRFAAAYADLVGHSPG